MDSHNKLKLVKREFIDRLFIALSDFLIEFGLWLKPKTGIELAVECPHCLESESLGQLVEFGKMYEITCNTCKKIFTVVIPPVEVRKGLLEGTNNDSQ